MQRAIDILSNSSEWEADWPPPWLPKEVRGAVAEVGLFAYCRDRFAKVVSRLFRTFVEA